MYDLTALVYNRVPSPLPDDLTDIDFLDMTPVDEPGEPVGVEPHACVLTVPVPDFDMCGVGDQAAVVKKPDSIVEWLGRPEPDGPFQDDLETEEFHRFQTAEAAVLG